MGFVSLQEDIDEATRLASLVAERLSAGKIAPALADDIIKAVLKRCDYINSAMEEVKKLHSDLSRDTRNRIYTLRSERDDALKRVAELELRLNSFANSREMRKQLAENGVVIPASSKLRGKKRKQKKKLRMPRGSPFR